MHILLAEDDPSIARLLLVRFGQRGYSLDWAHTGSEALSMIETRIPDLLLLDVRTPDIDGISVLRQIKSHASTARVPVIVVSANAAPHDIAKAMEACADAYILKPFQFHDLIEHIHRVTSTTP